MDAVLFLAKKVLKHTPFAYNDPVGPESQLFLESHLYLYNDANCCFQHSW